MRKIIPRVYILTAVHNSLKNTKQFLDCVKNTGYPNYETYVVDDGSTDGTLKYISKHFPGVKVIGGDGKLWWTKSLYLGVEKILSAAKKNDFILTINNDCVFEKNYVGQLVLDSLSNNRAIIGSLVVNGSDRKSIWDGGVRVDWNRGKFYGLGPKYVTDISSKKRFCDDIDTLSTKGTLYPVEVFKNVGNFDAKNLPHYLSDYEFAIRSKRNGFKLLLSYRAKVYNDVRRTGFGDVIARRVSISELFRLLFSRRSRVNVIDHWNFIRLACPTEYRIKNYLFVVLKIVYYLFHVPPLNLLLSIIKMRND